MASDDHSTWRVNAGFELHWRSWGDEYVVYHSGSGHTHLLNHTAATALRILQQTPAALPELCERLASEAGVEAGGDLSGALEELLADFARQGLIERVSP
ncbi:MAG TPA: HPr-rel-A system PqqD family peptide chaperone [Sedimenticola sp.]|nr:HPr-rel-A system PqqD family peptide chaperone [Sedimenticola sp.]